ncbi:MAG: hypothetical protein AB2793_18970, partial [Candidatus Thiodiazotropha sp.]
MDNLGAKRNGLSRLAATEEFWTVPGSAREPNVLKPGRLWQICGKNPAKGVFGANSKFLGHKIWDLDKGDPAARVNWFLPQICHKPKRARKENEGFLRITADRYFVAKTAPKGHLFP